MWGYEVDLEREASVRPGDNGLLGSRPAFCRGDGAVGHGREHIQKLALCEFVGVGLKAFSQLLQNACPERGHALMHIHIKLIHFIRVERNKFLKGRVVFENGDIDRRHPRQIAAFDAGFAACNCLCENVVVVAERLNLRPGVITLVIPERRDVCFVEMPSDVVENRGGASAFTRWEDDLHEGTPTGRYAHAGASILWL